MYSNDIEGYWCPPSNECYGIHANLGTIELSNRYNRMHENGVGIRFESSDNAQEGSRLHDNNACSGATTGYVDNVGGLICSIVNSNPATTGFFDGGIMLWNSCDTQVSRNSFYSARPQPFGTAAPTNGIGARDVDLKPRAVPSGVGADELAPEDQPRADRAANPITSARLFL